MGRRSLFFLSFVAATFTTLSCHHPAKVTGVDVQYVELNGKNDGKDTAIENVIDPYRDSMKALMDVVIAYSDTSMSKERDKLETILGNFTSDAVLNRINQYNCNNNPADTAGYCPYKASMVILNIGGLRSSLPKGDITRGNIFELMPFDNEIVVLTLSGKKTWEMLKFIAASGGEPEAGLKMGIHPDKSPGTVMIGGLALDTTHSYNIATSDYLANGGDKMDFMKDPLSLRTTGYKIRDAILDYCTQQTAAGKHLHPVLDGRLYYESK
ncbi:MAG TPA: 5'-nucleotidase C-terminal domain-containing protein [Bacteroidia bacterium]|jgi:2',3'-cyclic-nucleotide 2'-phosphodiesterase (5'-nucleotidase family)|nr:5'-nucleotidase C-terminal domain-containing protein [Bacteroidia bacterium]